MRANTVMSGVATGIRRNAAMTIALILSTAIALGFVGAALLASVEIGKFKHQYEDKINVSVYLCATQSQRAVHPQDHRPAQTPALRDASSAADPMVRSVELHLRGAGLRAGQGPAAGRGQVPAARRAARLVLGEAQGPAARTTTRSRAAYASQPGVGQVQNQIATINTLLDIIDSVQWFSIIIALIVLIAAILLMANTIQVAAEQRRNETEIMRLVGASRWMTELPFMLEAVIADRDRRPAVDDRAVVR